MIANGGEDTLKGVFFSFDFLLFLWYNIVVGWMNNTIILPHMIFVINVRKKDAIKSVFFFV